MTVRTLIELLQAMPNLDVEVLTNQCEASSAHEDIVLLDTVEEHEGRVYVGTAI